MPEPPAAAAAAAAAPRSSKKKRKVVVSRLTPDAANEVVKKASSVINTFIRSFMFDADILAADYLVARLEGSRDLEKCIIKGGDEANQTARHPFIEVASRNKRTLNICKQFARSLKVDLRCVCFFFDVVCRADA